MKRVIIYKSKTGFTEQYAKWLAEDERIECYSIKESKMLDLSSYDEVILGCSVFAGMIPAYGAIKKRNVKKLVIMAVGFTPDEDKKYADTIKATSKIVEPIFYVRGGICYEKLGFFQRALLKKVTKEPNSVNILDRSQLIDIKKYLRRA